MASKLESAGAYRFRITESGLSLTKKGYPQWVARLLAVEKFVEAPAEITHFQAQQLLADGKPGWVAWDSFGEESVEFFVLFNNADEFTTQTAMKNYEQLQTATGWDGAEFDALTNGSLVGKVILGRVDLDSYTPEGGTLREQMRVKWIDAADANPERTLKSVDATVLTGLSAKLKMGGASKAKAPAAKVASIAKPSAASVGTPSSPASTSAPANKPPTTTASAKSAPPKVTKKEKAVAPTTDAVPTNQGEAWAALVENKGAAEDQAVTDAWIAACNEVGPDLEPEKFTPAQWTKVYHTALGKITG